ncbi:MAG: hypothetical protein IJZ94_00575 [Clostridia bacterium]|nr:hypothetical protein [Clostridia bacterium]
MRPIKDIFTEEYWDVLYRSVESPQKGIFGGCKGKFRCVGSGLRYWYADPFLFEDKGELYLFAEFFDNKAEIGRIGCLKYKNGKFTEPTVVISENFHMSYPYVFKRDGIIYMMPETCLSRKLQLYKAIEFPYKWEQCRTIFDGVEYVDSVIYKDFIISNKRYWPEDSLSVDLNIYDFETGQPHRMNPIAVKSYCDRGAGAVFEMNGEPVRPVQNSVGKVYGKSIVFKKIKKLDIDNFEQEEFFTFSHDMINYDKSQQPGGTHTYAFLNGMEIVDVKLKRFNPKRIFWILLRRLKGENSAAKMTDEEWRKFNEMKAKEKAEKISADNKIS